MALVGTGDRGSFTWGQEVVEGYSDVVEIVGLCDINPKRVAAARKLIGTNAPSFVDFDRMIKETHPDTVMITTVDGTHARYIVRALELGCDVMTEKPLCTNEEQGSAILDAPKKVGKKVTPGVTRRIAKMRHVSMAFLLACLVSVPAMAQQSEDLNFASGLEQFRNIRRMLPWLSRRFQPRLLLGCARFWRIL